MAAVLLTAVLFAAYHLSVIRFFALLPLSIALPMLAEDELTGGSVTVLITCGIVLVAAGILLLNISVKQKRHTETG